MTSTTQEVNDLINWETLRNEGLKHLQSMMGQLWTDFNIHDPGVTIFELLCYAITDLDARLSGNIADLLSSPSGNAQFFSPGEALTVNPVTINDYRKLLIDIPGVKNAWLSPGKDTDPALYFDKDNNTLLYDYASGCQKVALNGLYLIYVEKDETAQDEMALKQQVFTKLYDHRNLCEEYIEINIMEQETVSVFTDIQIDENADANEVMAQIFYDLENFISPKVKQYSLKRLLQRGKTIEQIFNGPQLENGFIDDDELKTGQKRKELYASDLVRIIMAHPEVKDVRNLFIANKPTPDMSEKHEWALVLNDTKALVLESFNSSKIRMFKGETICPINTNEVIARVALLKEQNRREIFDDQGLDLPEMVGTATDLTIFESIGGKLPRVYGIGETGLTAAASNLQRAHARQLRAYLLFFEQILLNYLKQLDSFKRIFAFRQNREEILKTYFSQLLPESLWIADFPEISAGFEYLEDDPGQKMLRNENAFKRKNRILNHLLALFNERFADYAVFGFKYNMAVNVEPQVKNENYLKAKAAFLEKYPELSRNRNRAYNYLAAGPATLASDGLKALIAAKLGFDIDIENPSDARAGGIEFNNFHIVEHILFRPEGSLPLDFICSEKITENYQPDPYSYQLTFVIPKKAGRFGNNKFRELVYNTIETETPAHIAYRILEFDPPQMAQFIDAYQGFLLELKGARQGELNQYNSHRNQLIELLGIGRIQLPIFHLDAYHINGDGGEPVHEATVTSWKDLSRNNHDASMVTTGCPQFIKAGDKDLPWARFTQGARLKVANLAFPGDFSLIVVYKITVNPGREEDYFNLVTGEAGFTLGVKGNGNVIARLNNEMLYVESTTAMPHLAVLTWNQATKEAILSLDGVLHTSLKPVDLNLSPTPGAVYIGPDITTAACQLGEIIALNTPLTGSRRQKLEDYISAKWKIPLAAVSSIAEPFLQLDAANVVSVICDEKTNQVSQWYDLSANRPAAAQSDVALRPQYVPEGIKGLPALQFSHSALVISNPADRKLFAKDFTIAIVYQADKSFSHEEYLLLDGTSEDGTRSFSLALDINGDIVVRGENEEARLAATLNEPHIFIVSGKLNNDGLELTLDLDGKSFTAKTFSQGQIFNNCPNQLTLGRGRVGNHEFAGQIGEIMIYHQALPVWRRQRLENYLAAKWGVEIGVNQIATPVIHLDASRLATVMDETGAICDRNTRVSKWVDLSFTGNHAFQDNMSRKPEYSMDGIHGLGAIRFTQAKTGAEDYYEDSLTAGQTIPNDFTMMVVFQADAAFYLGPESGFNSDIDENTQWTDGSALVEADCSGRYNDFGLSLGKCNQKLRVMGGIGDRIAGDHTLKTGELDFTKAHFITFTRLKATGEVKLYADGLLQDQANLRDNVTLNDSRTMKIGAFNSEGNPFHGVIGEIIVFDSALNDQTRQRVEKYLSVKWGIPWVALPVDVANLRLHLDASNFESMVKEPDNTVSRWYYRNTQNSIAAVQERFANRPLFCASDINGMPGIQFNNSLMTVTPGIDSYDDFTIALVFKPLSTGNIYPDWNYGAGLVDNYKDGSLHSFGIAMNRNNELMARIGADSISAPVALNRPHIAIITRDGASGEVKLYLDGLLMITGPAFSPGVSLNDSLELTVGAIRIQPGQVMSKGYFHGGISELLILNTAFDMENRQTLEKYLSLKWRIDITGMKQISRPVLHLDASRMATVTRGAMEQKVSKWLDVNGLSNYAAQPDPALQPVYQPKGYNGLAALRFERSCLTIKPVAQNDFAIIIVYNTAPEINAHEYIPVAGDSFTGIAGVDIGLSNAIRDRLLEQGLIDSYGNVLAAFEPEKTGFMLGLDETVYTPIRGVIESNINTILLNYRASRAEVFRDAFTAIPGIDQKLSETVWTQLNIKKCINNDGYVPLSFKKVKGDFLNPIIESAIINVMLAKNWISGAGLFDGNCPGVREDLYKRDFGLLVKAGKLLAGFGVPGEKDVKVEADAAFGALHIGILTRKKETGETRLFVDNAEPVSARIDRDVTLKDSDRFTIGAVNTGGNYFKGDIAEIIVLDIAPDDSQIAEIQRYLRKKWGLT